MIFLPISTLRWPINLAEACCSSNYKVMGVLGKKMGLIICEYAHFFIKLKDERES